MGVNRVLFELALDDLYSEVQLIADDEDAKRTFAQLRCVLTQLPVVSSGSRSRLSANMFDMLISAFLNSKPSEHRHLFIRPSFLPAMDEDHSSDYESRSLEHNVSMMLISIKNGIKRATSNSPAREKATSDPSARIFKAASYAVKLCRNLHEISLIIHDHTLTLPFSHFLKSLWASDSVGPCLHSLMLDTTVSKLPLLVNPLTKRATSLPNLSSLDINISISRFAQSKPDWQAASDALVHFLKAFSGSLTSFAFSSLVSSDINALFGAFPKLPLLTSFEFRSVFNADTFPNAEAFTRFVHQHAQTLTTLVIKPRARSATGSSSDDSYVDWLHHPLAEHTTARLYSLTQLVLPKLRTLDVGLREMRGVSTPIDQTQRTDFGFLPNLTRVTPGLTQLVITDAKLTAERVMALFDMLGAQEGGSLLETLAVSTHVVYPQLFDRLAHALPGLRALTIECTRYRKSVSDESIRGWTDCLNTANVNLFLLYIT
jgi:hypothetical protein